jgi:hypothetical protein
LLRSVEIKAITASFTSKINTPEMLRIWVLFRYANTDHVHYQ